MIFLDELGPEAAKSFPDQQAIAVQLRPAARATQEIDYGRRGKGYVFGAFCSATSCVYFRSPAVLARVAADVDRISQSRLVLGVGIGIGDDPQEFSSLHIPWLSMRERQQALEETVHIVRGLWSEEPFSYRGTYFQLTEATGAPGPVQQPHIPLLIAGGGERVTLRQVAQYADMSNFGPHPDVGSSHSVSCAGLVTRHMQTRTNLTSVLGAHRAVASHSLHWSLVSSGGNSDG